MKIFITGGAGFIGSHFIKHIMKSHPHYKIICFDKLTYAGNMKNLSSVINNPNFGFIQGDISNKKHLSLTRLCNSDVIVNFAAESHVDRSIENANEFIETNIKGTQFLLDAAREFGIGKFIQISTDEVMGSCNDFGISFNENAPIRPNSPYAASKAAAELLVRAVYVTHGLDVVVTRASNNYGPNQYPEKLIPLMIKKALNNEKLPVYGDGLNVRDWLYVQDCCKAIDLVMHQGRSGEIYNIGSRNEKTNIEIVQIILDYLGKPRSQIEHVTDRLGHDLRYSINPTKIETELGWKPQESFENGIRKTIDWYIKEWN